MMNKYLNKIFILFISLFLIVSCQPSQIKTNESYLEKSLIEEIFTQTPTPCTGWECEISGTLYADVVSDGSELADVSVELEQISWCSPTKGIQTTVSASDGSFSFFVFLHDTDSFVITVDHPDFKPFEHKFGGFDCLYCNCSPFKLVFESN